MNLNKLINNKKVLIIFLVISLGLLLLIFYSFFKKPISNNQSDSNLPITAEQAKDKGLDVDKIKDSSKSGATQSVVFINFEALIDDNFTNKKLNDLKQTMQQAMPTDHSFELDAKSIQKQSISLPQDPAVVFVERKFNFTSNKVIYSMILNFRSEYDLTIIIKKGDEVVYSSPRS